MHVQPAWPLGHHYIAALGLGSLILQSMQVEPSELLASLSKGSVHGLFCYLVLDKLNAASEFTRTCLKGLAQTLRKFQSCTCCQNAETVFQSPMLNRLGHQHSKDQAKSRQTTGENVQEPQASLSFAQLGSIGSIGLSSLNKVAKPAVNSCLRRLSADACSRILGSAYQLIEGSTSVTTCNYIHVI